MSCGTSKFVGQNMRWLDGTMVVVWFRWESCVMFINLF